MKILVAGDVLGRLSDLEKRVVKACTKTPFEAVLCVGEFFSENDNDVEKYVSGERTFPIPLFFVLGETAHRSVADLETETEVAPNLIYLGRSGVRVVGDLRIAFLSGKFNEGVYEGGSALENRVHYASRQVADLVRASQAQPVEVLLTSEWPKGFHRNLSSDDIDAIKLFDPLAFDELESVGSEVVASVAEGVGPSYHFCGSMGRFYVRPPYANELFGDEKESRPFFSRLVCVAKLVKEKGLDKALSKSVYALDVPKFARGRGYSAAQGSTGCPYALGPVRTHVDEESSKKRARFTSEKAAELEAKHNARATAAAARAASGDDADEEERDAKRHKPRERKIAVRKDCWFCVSSETCERHLIVAVGHESYLTLPKGAIRDEHLLVVPLSHESSIASLDQDVRIETARFMASVHMYFASKDLDVVFFERRLALQKAAQNHCYLECLPIPRGAATSSTFEALSEAEGLEFRNLKANTKFALRPVKTQKEPEELSERHLKFSVNRSVVKHVVGSGGATIKSIQRETKASVVIHDDGTVWIDGETTEIVADAKRRVDTIADRNADLPSETAFSVEHTQVMRQCLYFLTGLHHRLKSKPDREYYYVHFPRTNAASIHFHRGGGSARRRRPLQFGRGLACRLLGVEERIEWQDCVASKEEETASGERVKSDFEPFEVVTE